MVRVARTRQTPRPGARTGLVLLGACGLATTFACRAPTEIRVRLTTDVPCTRLAGTTITVSQASDFETRAPTTASVRCSPDGELGDLTITPSGADTDEVSIKVVAGLGRDPSTCVAPTYGEGCIVARRILRFVPHDSLRLLVPLRLVCDNVVCDPRSTCSITGACRSAVVDTSGCVDDWCEGLGEVVPVDGGPGTAGGKDSGGPDSGGADTGARDGSPTDAQDSGGQDSGGQDSGGQDSGGQDSGGQDSGGQDSGGQDSGGVTFLDDFNRANAGELGNSWILANGAFPDFSIESNHVATTSSNGSPYLAAVLRPEDLSDVEVSVEGTYKGGVIPTGPGNLVAPDLLVRGSSSGLGLTTGYLLSVGNAELRIERLTGGVPATLHAVTHSAVDGTVKIRFRITGNQPTTLTGSIEQSSKVEPIVFVDVTGNIPSGRVGMVYRAGTTPFIGPTFDNFTWKYVP